MPHALIIRRLLERSLADIVHAALQENYRTSNLLLPNPGAELTEPIIERFVTGELPRPAGAALVDDWNCLRVRDYSPATYFCLCLCLPLALYAHTRTCVFFIGDMLCAGDDEHLDC